MHTNETRNKGKSKFATSQSSAKKPQVLPCRRHLHHLQCHSCTFLHLLHQEPNPAINHPHWRNFCIPKLQKQVLHHHCHHPFRKETLIILSKFHLLHLPSSINIRHQEKMARHYRSSNHSTGTKLELHQIDQRWRTSFDQSSFEFDEEMIESLFGYNLQNTIKMDEAKSKTPSPSKHVLDPKRLHNITILSKALNVTAAQVCGALIRGDGLSLQDLEALSKMVPTKEEKAKFSNYIGDVLELGSAEKLVKETLKIPFAFARIEAMLYRDTFEDEVFHLIKFFSMLEEACKELRSSRLFLKLLEAVLKTRNIMNIGTTRGGAKAFKKLRSSKTPRSPNPLYVF